MKIGKKIIAVLLVLNLFNVVDSSYLEGRSIKAAVVEVKDGELSKESKYITVENFITKVVKELGLKLDKSSGNAYMNAALREGIIKEKEFTNLTKNISRTDASVIMVRADEYLHGITIDDELVGVIIEKRLSDIDTVKKSKQSYVAKSYALGFMKGYSNGNYTTDREFRGSKKLTLSGANGLVPMLKDTSLRAIIAPDGQLTRTTKLPSNAHLYPYILASYPNDYYNWEFHYMKWFRDGVNNYTSGNYVNMKDYVAPKDMWKATPNGWVENGEIFQSKIELYGDDWEEKLREYLSLIFNVNYKTIADDKAWYNRLLELDSKYGSSNINGVKEDLDRYVKDMIKNRTIVESSAIAVDKSSMYYTTDGLYMRVYVKYRINSSLDNSQVRRSPIIFTRYLSPHFSNIKLGEWRHGYYDIVLGDNRSGEKNLVSKLGIQSVVLVDYYKTNPVLK